MKRRAFIAGAGALVTEQARATLLGTRGAASARGFGFGSKAVGGGLKVQDVFSVDLWTGNASSQTINNGINFSTNGGMVWAKDRSNAANHLLFDTIRGTNANLISNSTNAQGSLSSTLTAFNSNGYSIGSNGTINANTALDVGWSFRKAAKFFDVVTFTANGSGGATFSHSLGVTPGMIITKRTDSTSQWYSYHTSVGNDAVMNLCTTAAQSAFVGVWSVNSTSVTVANGLYVAGGTYVAYLFAHDPDTTNGIIQCGSFTSNSSGVISPVTLGWEPQYVLFKKTSGSGDWLIFDTSRGWGSGNDAALFPNSSSSEDSSLDYGAPTSTGFTVPTSTFGTSATVIYMVIRKGPM